MIKSLMHTLSVTERRAKVNDSSKCRAPIKLSFDSKGIEGFFGSAWPKKKKAELRQYLHFCTSKQVN
jgi:hypothetical protein